MSGGRGTLAWEAWHVGCSGSDDEAEAVVHRGLYSGVSPRLMNTIDDPVSFQ